MREKRKPEAGKAWPIKDSPVKRVLMIDVREAPGRHVTD